MLDIAENPASQTQVLPNIVNIFLQQFHVCKLSRRNTYVIHNSFGGVILCLSGYHVAFQLFQATLHLHLLPITASLWLCQEYHMWMDFQRKAAAAAGESYCECLWNEQRNPISKFLMIGWTAHFWLNLEILVRPWKVYKIWLIQFSDEYKLQFFHQSW